MNLNSVGFAKISVPNRIELDNLTISTGESQKESPTSFAKILQTSLQKLNDEQIEVHELVQKSVVDPSSTQIHQIMFAESKAMMSLMLAKTVVEKVTQAYKEIVNMR